ncbi:MAG TPA: NUDIX hydrolase [Patescibacteria group bacterium]|nr:NUDIX hydrolase [Patescibacteria group bacterium]
MEIVDIVDATGNVLSSVRKDEAHQKGLLHKCVIAALRDSSDKFMLIRPPVHKQDAGQYVFPVGGHVSSGESEGNALKREVEEEIGITKFEQKRMGQAIFDRHILGRHENHLFVLFEILSDQKPTSGPELETMHWFSPERLQEEIKQNPPDFGDAFYFVAERFYPELLK